MTYRVSDPDLITSRGINVSPMDRCRKPLRLSEHEIIFLAEKRAKGVPDRAIADMLGRPLSALGQRGAA